MSTNASSALLNAYSETDPEFVQRFGAFAFEQVPHQAPLDSATQMLTILSALLGCQGIAASVLWCPLRWRLASQQCSLRKLSIKPLLTSASEECSHFCRRQTMNCQPVA